MQHTFILSPGEWRVDGKYSDQSEQIDAFGTVRFIHEHDIWLYESEIHFDEKEERHKTEYRIEPFDPGQEFLNWESNHPTMGRLRGKFLLVEDTIISQFASEESEFVGSEVMLLQRQDKYYSRGVIFRGNQKISSWSFHLERVF